MQALPGFPVKAYREGYRAGRVRLSYVVMPDGRVGGVQVLEVTPVQVFTRAASNAVEGWRFAPTGTEERRTVDIHFSAQ
jgi:protein TonB